MLTVRIIREHPNDGPFNEVVFQAAYVIKGSDAQNVNGLNSMVEFYNADHTKAGEPAYFGDVFVMNDAGHTVSTFRLPSGLPARINPEKGKPARA